MLTYFLTQSQRVRTVDARCELGGASIHKPYHAQTKPSISTAIVKTPGPNSLGTAVMNANDSTVVTVDALPSSVDQPRRPMRRLSSGNRALGPGADAVYLGVISGIRRDLRIKAKYTCRPPEGQQGFLSRYPLQGPLWAFWRPEIVQKGVPRRTRTLAATSDRIGPTAPTSGALSL